MLPMPVPAIHNSDLAAGIESGDLMGIPRHLAPAYIAAADRVDRAAKRMADACALAQSRGGRFVWPAEAVQTIRNGGAANMLTALLDSNQADELIELDRDGSENGDGDWDGDGDGGADEHRVEPILPCRALLSRH